MIDLYNQFLDCLNPNNNTYNIKMSIKDFNNPELNVSE